MANISSTSITIFPLNKHREGYPQDNLLYENNLANIIRQLIDVEGFIISGPDTLESVSIENPLILNIYGYYIKLTDLPQVETQGTKVYIKLLISDSRIPEVDGQDDGNIFTGVQMVDSVTEGDHYLCISKDGVNINKDAFYKFTFNSLNIKGIDGKPEK